MEKLQGGPDRASPTNFAVFQLVQGKRERLAVGDEYVVRMPGPSDGPIRLVDVGPRSFRLATLAGHLEAGQVEFRTDAAGETGLVFESDSWARSSSPVLNLVYHRLRMAKEVQAHIWIFVPERVKLSGRADDGGVELDTGRIEMSAAGS